MLGKTIPHIKKFTKQENLSKRNVFVDMKKDLMKNYPQRKDEEQKKRSRQTKQKYVYIFVVIIVLVAAYFAVYYVFFGDGLLTAGKDLHKSDWLSFLGSYLSFVGTILLGIVAIYQNNRANMLNQQMQKLQHASFVSMVSVEYAIIEKEDTRQPEDGNDVQTIETVDLTADGFTPKSNYIVNVSLKNSSNYPIVFLYVHVGAKNYTNAFLYHIKDHQKAIYIPEKGSSNIQLIIPADTLDKLDKTDLAVLFDFYNVFDYHTEAYLYLNLDTGEYKYRVSKFTDVKQIL